MVRMKIIGLHSLGGGGGKGEESVVGAVRREEEVREEWVLEIGRAHV